jgi:hypothetical protein
LGALEYALHQCAWTAGILLCLFGRTRCVAPGGQCTTLLDQCESAGIPRSFPHGGQSTHQFGTRGRTELYHAHGVDLARRSKVCLQCDGALSARGVWPEANPFLCIALCVGYVVFLTQLRSFFQLIGFWTISALQLLLLARTLPKDQDSMEAELACYAEQAMLNHSEAPDNESDSLVSIDDRRTSFDGVAVRETLLYVREGFKEIRAGVVGSKYMPFPYCSEADDEGSSEDEDPLENSQEEVYRRRDVWLRRQMQQALSQSENGDQTVSTEATPLVV